LPSSAAVAKLPQLGEFVSPPYSEYAKLINKVSHNLGANLVPPVLAARKGQHTFKAGMQIIENYVRDAGADPSQVSLVDGQGLADKSSPLALVTFLRFLSKQSYFKVFFDSTPILGVDGSLVGVVPASDPAVGHAHAKTGTGVTEGSNGELTLQTKNLAGYIDAPHGGQLAFAMCVNNVPMKSIQTALDANSALGAMASSIYTSQQRAG
jgi:D-alanyl-D-alanine carboxypeptidase/D-alanyl-D-alanine-endopeptidase (penicillin-binding protein 4)